MDTNRNTILACIDGSQYSEAVCEYATWISNRLSLPLQLFHNIAKTSAPVTDLSGAIGLNSQQQLMEELTELEEARAKILLQQGKLLLEAAKGHALSKGASNLTTNQRHGGLSESLLEIEDSIRVLVLGGVSEESADTSPNLSTNLESTIRALHSPILLVNNEFREPKRVMLAYDGSAASGKALDMISKSPLFVGIPIHLVTVGGQQANLETLQAEATKKLEQGGHTVVSKILRGRACDVLCQYQSEEDIDITLMGSFSHSRLREIILGSTTAKMLLKANKPLWLLR